MDKMLLYIAYASLIIITYDSTQRGLSSSGASRTLPWHLLVHLVLATEVD